MAKIGPMSTVDNSKEYRVIIESMQRFLAAAPIAWFTKWLLALEVANQALRYGGAGAGVIMTYFSGSNWCQICQHLDTEVFTSETFRLWFNQRRMVPMLVDFPHQSMQDQATIQQNAQLATQYNLGTGVPVVMAIKADGTEIGRLDGYAVGSGPDNWIAAFKQMSGIS